GVGLRSRHAVPQVGDADVFHVHLGVVVAMPNTRTPDIWFAFGSGRSFVNPGTGRPRKRLLCPSRRGSRLPLPASARSEGHGDWAWTAPSVGRRSAVLGVQPE